MASPLRGQSVVVFSTADWDTLLPTNKHQVARRFARRGARVLFIETLGTRAPRLGSGMDLGRIVRRLGRAAAGARRREKRLWTLSPLVRPAWATAPQIAANRLAFGVQYGALASRFPGPIAWVYSPYAVHLLDAVKPSRVVYHLVDDLAAVPGADRAAIREAEARLMARADAIVCTERSLYDRARRIAPEAAHLLPNVADFAHFSRPGACADPRLGRLRALPHPRIVFAGHLANHKVDVELIDALATRHPQWQWVLIGPVWEGEGSAEAFDRLDRHPQITRLGHVDYHDLPAFLHEADVLAVPYRLNEVTRAVSPLKLFEYLATGRPVVTSPLPSMLPYGGAVGIADGVEPWSAALAGALENPHAGTRQRRALARRHDWEQQINSFERVLFPDRS